MTPSPPAAAPTAAETNARAAELLLHAARRFHHAARAHLTPLGITWAQARMMRLIAEPGPSMRMADIAARLGIVPRSATSQVDALEAAGLVSRRSDPQDRRSILVGLTPGGRRLLDGLDAAHHRTADAMFGGLAPAERAELIRLLELLPGCDDTCAGRRARP